MNIRRIECFLAVVDLGTVTAASHKLHLAQPALSRQIQTLEQELGLQLFEHHRNRLALTAAGHTLVPLARQLLEKARSIRIAAQSLASGQLRDLRIAATPATISELIAPFITTLGRDDPMILTVDAPHADLLERFHQGMDMVVTPSALDSDLRSLYLGRAPLRAYVWAAHPWALEGRSEIALAELLQHDLLLLGSQNISRIQLDLAVARAGLAYRGVSECGHATVLQALCAAGRGIGIVTDLPRFGAYSLRVIDPLPSPAQPYLGIDLHAGWSAEHYCPQALEAIALRLAGFLQSID
ncbi:LysR family transcriptional regulator [Pseudomonas sp. 17391]|uniref:LysR family transcriptional regulator n=1 Tax=Pseudomonas TaxID=286 RepID=UPI000BA3701D|nr:MULTISPECIES: LysR family transcriptional regulator [unclassified Pseudomonas]MDD2130593.1 LysR family transcriptional regulator [Pseudomonas sp. 17391]UDU79225.1 LysR family transcriptional regulator [Pseudomonas sp. HN2-3]